MVPAPVPCDLGTQTPQGPRAPLGPHITGYEQAVSSYSEPFAKSYSSTASGQVLAQGKTGKFKPPTLHRQKAGCGLFTNLWGAITASHSTAGPHGSMQTPRFLAESCQSCRGHHLCYELPCCSPLGVQTEECSAKFRDPGRADGVWTSLP